MVFKRRLFNGNNNNDQNVSYFLCNFLSFSLFLNRFLCLTIRISVLWRTICYKFDLMKQRKNGHINRFDKNINEITLNIDDTKW